MAKTFPGLKTPFGMALPSSNKDELNTEQVPSTQEITRCINRNLQVRVHRPEYTEQVWGQTCSLIIITQYKSQYKRRKEALCTLPTVHSRHRENDQLSGAVRQ